MKLDLTKISGVQITVSVFVDMQTACGGTKVRQPAMRQWAAAMRQCGNAATRQCGNENNFFLFGHSIMSVSITTPTLIIWSQDDERKYYYNNNISDFVAR